MKCDTIIVRIGSQVNLVWSTYKIWEYGDDNDGARTNSLIVKSSKGSQ